LKIALGRIGYAVAGAHAYPPSDVIAAFQRRFRPAQITGVADEETCALIADLDAKVTSDTFDR